nr:colorectal cancer-associated protein 2 isoform X1 [Saimiri boliviensis boliviensis]
MRVRAGDPERARATLWPLPLSVCPGGQRPRGRVGRSGRPRTPGPRPRFHFSAVVSLDFAARILSAQKRQRWELEAHGEPGTGTERAGCTEPSCGGPYPDPKGRPLPAEPGADRGTGWRGGEKPKVYQGVRVKITVKELLQQRRAHQAASGGTRSGGSSVHLSDPVAPSSAGLYFEPEPISSTPNYFQPREFSSCVSCEENSSCLDQIFDSYLQTEMHPAEPLLNSIQSTPHHFPDSFQAAPFCFNQSLIPGSPSNSSTLSGSLDYSYSPVQLPSYAPENYNSPTSLDTRNCGYPPEDHSYHHLPSHAQYSCFSSATASICYCASCEAEDLDALQVAQYLYPSTDCVDFAPSAATTTDFYQRETNCDICYS